MKGKRIREVKAKGSTIATLSGRIGNFMFRTYGNGKITVYYKPKRKNTTGMDRDWTENGPIMDELREILRYFHLEIVEESRMRSDAN